ncbi:MAG: nucleoside 2-deoxyribosyltransferase [Alphaproteobacteria bacterium]|nr:nucleoside 2-deoxyribosyltransferase [Alphaproteobacteria bacterium]
MSRTAPRIYLAGPEVFLPDAGRQGAVKREACAELGLEGIFPLDGSLPLDGLPPREQARRISLANEELLRSCDAIIANMTPFRGAAMDSGTAFEVGFMRALRRPVFGYTNSAPDYATRARAVRLCGMAPEDFDGPDVEIEDFGLAENLMIAVAVSETGADVFAPGASAGDVQRDLTGFRSALAAAARHFQM